ncbi:predicted protein [Nematostella vectensis]|uniref:EGF-like domain-containing protein n=1 Tax=Nematostella vectensis TaxID=45351 RepID=A7RNB0_NEMVE|nr:predicted protein [Nematostella vectensis]|eukprot:XP_001639172.1 predicted protein [Nematostella vectensis]
MRLLDVCFVSRTILIFLVLTLCENREIHEGICSRDLGKCKSCKQWVGDGDTNLFWYDCSNATLQTIPTSLPRNLGSLFLNTNHIRALQAKAFANYLSLRVLDLSNNELSVIANGTFKSLGKLKTLTLNSNRLEVVYAETFRGLRDLRYLSLRHNSIRTIGDGAFRFSAFLICLDISFNRLSEFKTETLRGLSSTLTELRLRSNILRRVAIKRRFNITLLDLGDNLLEVFEVDAFDGLSLRKLRLDGNKLDEIPEAFAKVGHFLQELDMSGNYLHEITSDQLLDLHAIERLDLNENNISKIRIGALRGMKKLRQISLSGNPLSCDCRLVWLKHVLDSRQDQLHLSSPQSTTCASPASVKGQTFLGLDARSFLCTCAQCVAESERCFGRQNTSCRCDTEWRGNTCTNICARGEIVNTFCAYIAGECRCSENCPRYSQSRNVSGSIICECKKGFVREPEGCVDIDECVYPRVCSEHAKCINTHGSYLCTCVEPYVSGPGGCVLSSDSSSRVLVIVGSVVVSVAVLVVVVCLMYYLLWRSRYREESEAEVSMRSGSTRREERQDEFMPKNKATD